MHKQIRITKTAEIERVLIALRNMKYPLMEESEIVKYLLSKDYTETIHEKQETTENKKKTLNTLYSYGEKLGKQYLKKKGLRLEDISDEQLYELVEQA